MANTGNGSTKSEVWTKAIAELEVKLRHEVRQNSAMLLMEIDKLSQKVNALMGQSRNSPSPAYQYRERVQGQIQQTQFRSQQTTPSRGLASHSRYYSQTSTAEASPFGIPQQRRSGGHRTTNIREKRQTGEEPPELKQTLGTNNTGPETSPKSKWTKRAQGVFTSDESGSGTDNEKED